MRSATACPGLLGLAAPPFGPHRIFARRCQRRFGGARGAVGLGGRFDGLGQASAAPRCAASAASSASSASARRAAICVGGRLQASACSASAASRRARQLADPVGRHRAARCAQSARSAAMATRRAVRAACSRRQRIAFRRARRLARPGGGQRRARRLDRRRRAARSGRAPAPRAPAPDRRRPRRVPAASRVDLAVDRRQPGGDRGRPGRASCAACGAGPLEPRSASARRGTRLLSGSGRCPIGALRPRPARARADAASRFGRCEIALQQRQPVALLQPNRRGGRGAGADRVAVPPPDSAFAGHQQLARRKLRLRCVAGRVIFDQADLRQRARRAPAGPCTKPASGVTPAGSGGADRTAAVPANAAAASRIRGGGQFLAQRRAERGFQARPGRSAHRPSAASARRP